jgi:hypothetical protein
LHLADAELCGFASTQEKEEEEGGPEAVVDLASTASAAPPMPLEPSPDPAIIDPEAPGKKKTSFACCTIM